MEKQNHVKSFLASIILVGECIFKKMYCIVLNYTPYANDFSKATGTHLTNPARKSKSLLTYF